MKNKIRSVFIAAEPKIDTCITCMTKKETKKNKYQTEQDIQRGIFINFHIEGTFIYTEQAMQII